MSNLASGKKNEDNRYIKDLSEILLNSIVIVVMFCVYIFTFLLRSDKGKLIIDMNLRYECHNFVMFNDVIFLCLLVFLIILYLF